MYAAEDAVLTAQRHRGLLCRDPGGDGGPICQLRADQSLRSHRREPGALSTTCSRRRISTRPIPWMTWAAASRARCWTAGPVPSPRPFRRKCASTPMTSPPMCPAAPLWTARACASATRCCRVSPRRCCSRSMPARMCGKWRWKPKCRCSRTLPLIQAFDLNLAGRYTDYSVSGSVQTWKIGFNWNVVDSLRFRGTTSIDIRAPTLDDLFRPATLLQNVFTDLHIPDPTKSQVPNPQYYAGTTTFSSQGNPNLVPEVSRTYTVGAVWTPDFVPGLTMSLDYYRIHLANAIGSIAPSTTIQTHLRGVGRHLDLLRELSASAAVQRSHASRISRPGSSPSTSTPPPPRPRAGTSRPIMAGRCRTWWRAGTGSWNGAAAGDLSAGHQQIGAFPGRALHTLARSQHPHHRFPELHPERLELRSSG